MVGRRDRGHRGHRGLPPWAMAVRGQRGLGVLKKPLAVLLLESGGYPNVPNEDKRNADGTTTARSAAVCVARKTPCLSRRPHDQSCGQSSELWERATGPTGGLAKRQGTRLTCRGSRALDEPSIAAS